MIYATLKVQAVFLAATAALEVQMLVRVSVCPCVTLATTVLTKALNFKVFRLNVFCRTSEGLLKDF